MEKRCILWKNKINAIPDTTDTPRGKVSFDDDVVDVKNLIASCRADVAS